MTEESKTETLELETLLELNKETLRDLTELGTEAADLGEEQAEAVRGGSFPSILHCTFIEASPR
jgi:hypothetical protein